MSRELLWGLAVGIPAGLVALGVAVWFDTRHKPTDMDAMGETVQQLLGRALAKEAGNEEVASSAQTADCPSLPLSGSRGPVAPSPTTPRDPSAA